MSCKSGANSNSSIYVPNGKNGMEIKELIKVKTIEEANNLIKDGHVFLSVYWNTDKAHEEYIFGKQEKVDKPDRQVGFFRD